MPIKFVSWWDVQTFAVRFQDVSKGKSLQDSFGCLLRSLLTYRTLQESSYLASSCKQFRFQRMLQELSEICVFVQLECKRTPKSVVCRFLFLVNFKNMKGAIKHWHIEFCCNCFDWLQRSFLGEWLKDCILELESILVFLSDIKTHPSHQLDH